MNPASPPPVLVVALGGNALSPPARDLSFQGERAAIDCAAAELAGLARAGYRLLVVHGNGPQVGRLLAAERFGDPDHLDIHVAQTQGEIGYLIAAAMDRHLGAHQSVAVVTRVQIDPDDPAFARPTKPVGVVLHTPPADVPFAPTPEGNAWRRVVASPRPQAVVEAAAIRSLLGTLHVVAGGGGGIAVTHGEDPRPPRGAVIDKDWVAALLAVSFDAAALVFVTDVAHAFDRYGRLDQHPIPDMTPAAAKQRLADGVFAPGSMAPKVESAIQFVEATGRPAFITTLGAVAAAMDGAAGTSVRV